MAGFDPSTEANAALAALTTSDHWILTPDFSNEMTLHDLAHVLSRALDRFQAHIHADVADHVSADIGFTVNVPLTLDIWKPTEIFEVTPTFTAGPFLIGDQPEGVKFEKSLLTVLDSVYEGQAYLSPLVHDGKAPRELADALAFDERFICVVEAKALAVLSANRDQSSRRRIANIEKDIRKGLRQLGGAMSNIRSRTPILRRDVGTAIKLVDRETSPAHAILVLSEMYFGVDWKAVARLVAEASQSELHRALFHVLDLRELATLATGCEDSAGFGKRLIQRWGVVQEKGTCYVRTMLPF